SRIRSLARGMSCRRLRECRADLNLPRPRPASRLDRVSHLSSCRRPYLSGMQVVENWTDPSYPPDSEQRFIEGEPYGDLRPPGDPIHATSYFGLRTVRRGSEISQMALIDG